MGAFGEAFRIGSGMRTKASSRGVAEKLYFFIERSNGLSEDFGKENSMAVVRQLDLQVLERGTPHTEAPQAGRDQRV